MRLYESTFVVDGKAPETEIDKCIEKFSQVIKGTGGEILKTDKLGKRELAYKIGSSKDGFYVYFELKLNEGAVAELERNYRIVDSVIRYLTVLKDTRIVKPKKIKKVKVPAAATTSTTRVAAPVAEPLTVPVTESEPQEPAK